MREPVWRQFGKGELQHIAYFCHLPRHDGPQAGPVCGPFDGSWLRPEDEAHDRPDLPKCKRCLALLAREKRP
jgi:hypothetical protein